MLINIRFYTEVIDKMQLRPAVANDLKYLQKIANDVIDKNYRSFLGDEAVDYFIESGASNNHMKENIGDTTVAIVKEEIVALCICKSNLVDLIMVKNEFHRQGVGTRFLSEICKQLFCHYTEIHLESFEKNVKANQFYKKNGWVIEKIVLDEEVNDNRVYYVKQKQ